jgi:anti-anti-sigma factor
MPVVVEQKQDVTVVRVDEAKLTYGLLAPFFAAVRDVVDGGARQVVVDMEAVSYIDSATIGCLMDIHRLLAERGGAVSVTGLQRRVRTLLSMTGVLKILNGRAPAGTDQAA